MGSTPGLRLRTANLFSIRHPSFLNQYKVCTEMAIENKVALVTGAGQGIGRGIALRLAKEGASLMLVDVNPEGIAAVAAEVEALGVRPPPSWRILLNVTRCMPPLIGRKKSWAALISS
jgi:NAD(P)-dependent dehydrogenase (short-subunit alcohol dehydrogenase family)